MPRDECSWNHQTGEAEWSSNEEICVTPNGVLWTPPPAWGYELCIFLILSHSVLPPFPYSIVKWGFLNENARLGLPHHDYDTHMGALTRPSIGTFP